MRFPKFALWLCATLLLGKRSHALVNSTRVGDDYVISVLLGQFVVDVFAFPLRRQYTNKTRVATRRGRD